MYRNVIELGLAAIVACLVVVLGVMLLTDEPYKEKPIVKINAHSNIHRVNALFRKNTTATVAYQDIVWVAGENELAESDVFNVSGVTTPEKKQKLRLALEKEKAKRYKKICYNLHATQGNWSLGYCVYYPSPASEIG